MAELETLGKVYPFSIPPFFALILRAFSVIEGIALTVDPDYSIVQVCLYALVCAFVLLLWAVVGW
jgi:aarF domain-containing kinase